MLIHQIKRKLLHLRLQPIRVFVFHQVSETFDPTTMWKCDWTETKQFKKDILELKQKYEFIPLTEAHNHLLHDIFRLKKYAVLTCDDGWSSLTNIIPWLAEQQIHITLFLNPSYLNEEETRENNMKGLLKTKEVNQLLDIYKPYISVGSHGWNHDNCDTQKMDTFASSVINSNSFLAQFGSSYINFFAYPCGRHTAEQDSFLKGVGIIPVYCDGIKNYNNPDCIHRICIDGL